LVVHSTGGGKGQRRNLQTTRGGFSKTQGTKKSPSRNVTAANKKKWLKNGYGTKRGSFLQIDNTAPWRRRSDCKGGRDHATYLGGLEVFHQETNCGGYRSPHMRGFCLGHGRNCPCQTFGRWIFGFLGPGKEQDTKL